jgi:dolichyl-phosphate-mannose-protein mannosyltransferase
MTVSLSLVSGIKSYGNSEPSAVDDEDYYERASEPPKEPKKMSFLKKFAELQLLMLQHNAGLTASHPYASAPINWPFLLSGISFWTEGERSEQIYLIGNLIGWWTCVMALSIFVGILGADLLARRRNIYPLEERAYSRSCLSPQFDSYLFPI